MITEPPHLTVSRVFDAPRALVFRAFTDPDQLAMWWGPQGHSLVRSEIESDVRPGGFQRWTEVAVDEPDLRVRVSIDLTDVADGDLLEGVMRIAGSLCRTDSSRSRRGSASTSTMRPQGRTRLEIRQWLPGDLAAPTSQGWIEAFEKLDVVLLQPQTTATDMKE